MKIKKNVFYNFIVLRDDKSLKSFRIKKGYINVFLFLIGFLLIYSVVSPYFLWSLYKQKIMLIDKLKDCSVELNQSKFSLKRLENLKKILDKYDEEYLQKVISGVAENKEKKAIDLSKIFEILDLNIVKISNVQCFKNKNYFVLIFELNNLEAEKETKGEVFIDAITKDGVVFPLDVKDEDLKFLITRFKRVEANFRLPSYIPEESVFAFRLTVKDNNKKVIFRETYLLSSILI